MNEQIKKTAKEFLVALDQAIANGSWDETNFVLIIGKKLKEMRDDLAEKIKKVDESTDISSDDFFAKNVAMRDSLKEVFISLYSLEGVKLQSWEHIVANLRRQIVSRPVYDSEDEVINLIKTKEKKINEAYISIFVRKEDVLEIKADKIPVDKLGQKLLTLKDNAVSLENINFFKHLSGKYRYIRGRLLKSEVIE